MTELKLVSTKSKAITHTITYKLMDDKAIRIDNCFDTSGIMGFKTQTLIEMPRLEAIAEYERLQALNFKAVA